MWEEWIEPREQKCQWFSSDWVDWWKSIVIFLWKVIRHVFLCFITKERYFHRSPKHGWNEMNRIVDPWTRLRVACESFNSFSKSFFLNFLACERVKICFHLESWWKNNTSSQMMFRSIVTRKSLTRNCFYRSTFKRFYLLCLCARFYRLDSLALQDVSNMISGNINPMLQVAL